MSVRPRTLVLVAAALLAPGAVAHAQYADGTVTTAAGPPAGLSQPRDVAILADGSFVVADFGNGRIRRIAPDGTVTTDVGGLDGPRGVTAFTDGGYLIAEAGADRILRFFPDGSTAPVAAGSLDEPSDIHVLPDGTLLIADTGHDRVQRVDPLGNVTTAVGDLHDPRDVSVDSYGAILVADTGADRIVRVGPDGRSIVVAGTGAPGLSGDGDPARGAQVRAPQSVTALTNGGFVFTDTLNDRVRRVTPLGAIFTIPGTTQLEDPTGLAVAPGGGFLVGDTGHGTVLRVSDFGRVPDAVVDRSVRLAPVSGDVGVAPRGLNLGLPLREEDLVPLGSDFDTRKGRIAVATQLPDGTQQVAEAFEGQFNLFQQAGGMTNFRLLGLACPAPSATPRATIAKKKRRKRRRLWVKESGGRWRSSTDSTTASAVGTMWLTELRCDGTLVSVTEGIVRVRDKRTGRRRLVKAGQSFLNPARR
jgi:sugar lactone lactonase YvrE